MRAACQMGASGVSQEQLREGSYPVFFWGEGLPKDFSVGGITHHNLFKFMFLRFYESNKFYFCGGSGLKPPLMRP